MNTKFETQNLFLEVLPPSKAALVADFFDKNFENFAKYEPLGEDARTVLLHKKSLEYEFRQFKEKKFIRVYFFEKHNPFRIIGTVSYRDMRYGNFKKTIVGYKMDENYRRKGYCFEAIHYMNGLIFNHYNLNRIEATVLPDNTPSIMLLEKLGFKEEGILRDFAFLEGQWKDHLLFSMIKKDYR